MQARNTHQVRHAGGTVNVPVGAFDGILVADHQRRQHTGQLAIGNPPEDRLAHRLTGALNRMRPAVALLLRRCVARTGPDVAGGLQPLLPQPQFVIKTVRVAVAMRRL